MASYIETTGDSKRLETLTQRLQAHLKATKKGEKEREKLKEDVTKMRSKVESGTASEDKLAEVERKLTEAEESYEESKKLTKTDLEETKKLTRSLASTNECEPSDVVYILSEHLKSKDLKRFEDMLKQSKSLDLCFVIDMTNSMLPSMDAVKECVRGIVRVLQTDFGQIPFNLGIVGYRDVGDGDKRYSLHPFSGSITDFEKFLHGQVAIGGDDTCEDTLGGLWQASQFDWKYQNKMCVLIADAPCHGAEFHDGCQDEYPSGTFPGSRKAQDVIAALKQHEIKMSFFGLNHSTDKMIRRLNELAGHDWIESSTINIKNKTQEEASKIIATTLSSKVSEYCSKSIIASTAGVSATKSDCKEAISVLSKSLTGTSGG